jgi:hypothetical protein
MPVSSHSSAVIKCQGGLGRDAVFGVSNNEEEAVVASRLDRSKEEEEEEEEEEESYQLRKQWS